MKLYIPNKAGQYFPTDEVEYTSLKDAAAAAKIMFANHMTYPGESIVALSPSNNRDGYTVEGIFSAADFGIDSQMG
jgi:hypothetical protein